MASPQAEEDVKKSSISILTTFNNPQNIEDCYQYGGNSYIIKSINFAQLKRDIQTLLDYWFEVTTLPSELED